MPSTSRITLARSRPTSGTFASPDSAPLSPRTRRQLREAVMRVLATILGWSGLALYALWPALTVEAAEIKVLSTVGMQPATPQIFAEFERTTGHTVTVVYGLAAVLKSKFLEGAPADVLILTAPIIEDLAKQGKVVPGSKVDV